MMDVSTRLEKELDRLDIAYEHAIAVAEENQRVDPDLAIRALDTAARLSERKAAILGLHRDTE